MAKKKTAKRKQANRTKKKRDFAQVAFDVFQKATGEKPKRRSIKG
jgi:hypothetical protein